MESAAAKRVVVNVISDVVCPWCYIGKRTIELAAAEAHVSVDLRWHPFQLDDTIPVDQSQDKMEVYTKKFGARAKELVADPNNMLNKRGRPMGIAFEYFPGSKVFNTRRAHRLLQYALQKGGSELQNRVQEVLFRRYFTEGKDLGLVAELVQAAVEAGMAHDDVVALLQRPESTAETRELNAELQRSHSTCTGVPHFTFASGKVISGGDSIEAFAAALKREAATQ